MLGAIIGDIVGSPYEFDHNNIKTEDFPLFKGGSHYTDDSVMTAAVAEALMNALEKGTGIGEECMRSMQTFGKRHPGAGYGARFSGWLASSNPEPYNSWGNGSAMRVSAAGWLFDTLERTEEAAAQTAAVTHNHPEGIKGAQATAVAIFLARTGASKEDIKAVIEERYGYDLDRTLDQIRPSYHHVESCQESVPEAIIAFLESSGFESALRKAVSIGGDSDTIACITGSIAEAFYGIPGEIEEAALQRLPEDLLEVVQCWDAKLQDLRCKAAALESAELT